MLKNSINHLHEKKTKKQKNKKKTEKIGETIKKLLIKQNLWKS